MRIFPATLPCLLAILALSPAQAAPVRTVGSIAQQRIETVQDLAELRDQIRQLPAGEREAFLAAIRIDPRIIGGDPVETPITRGRWRLSAAT